MRGKFMNEKYCRLIRLNKVIASTLILIVTLTAYSISKSDASQRNIIETNINEPISQNANTDKLNIDVGVYFSITIDDKVKGVDPNIIRATRQAMFDYYCNNAKLSQYDGYLIRGDVVIMDVKKTKKDTWEVDFVPKNQTANYPNGYSAVSVEKQKTGSYKGVMIHQGNPMDEGSMISKTDDSQKNVIETSINKLANKNIKVDTFDANVSICFSITLDDKVKDVDPNIIMATRQAMFDYYCDNAKFWHYNGYSITGDVVIMDVEKIKKDSWEVKFVPKSSIANYPNGYSILTVEKRKSGSYKGIMPLHGSPLVTGGETY